MLFFYLGIVHNVSVVVVIHLLFLYIHEFTDLARYFVFIVELKKQSSCSVQLTNTTNHYVAFKVRASFLFSSLPDLFVDMEILFIKIEHWTAKSIRYENDFGRSRQLHPRNTQCVHM